MAEFLTTEDVTARLQKIIREANEYLVFISPYLQLNSKVKDLLSLKGRSNTPIRIIYRTLNVEEKEWLDSQPGVELFVRRNLHAKCYLNEKEAILTSMNLYEYSQQNNYEMGILVSKTEDRELYEDIMKEVGLITEISEKVREVPDPKRTRGSTGRIQESTAESSSTDSQRTDAMRPDSGTYSRGAERGQVRETPSAYSPNRTGYRPAPLPTEPAARIPASGFCIRCKANLDIDPGKPYCYSCYQTWNRYKDVDYEEVYCHICGKYNDSTMRKPLCYACYQQYKDLFAVDALPL